MRFVRLILVLALVFSVAEAATPGAQEYKLGRKAEKKGLPLKAWSHYLQARIEDPGNLTYIRSAERLSIAAAQLLAAAGRPAEAQQVDPAGSYPIAEKPDDLAVAEQDAQFETELSKLPLLRPPAELKPESKLGSFKIKDTVHKAYAEVAQSFGLDVVFDSDFDADDKIRFEIEDARFTTIIGALNDVANAFVIPLGPRLFMVAEDNQNKRRELEPVVSVAVSLPDAMTPEEVNEIAQAVQGVVDIQRQFVSNSANMVLLRDTVSKVRMAQALFAYVSKPRGQVVVEVELISLNRGQMRELGIELPTSATITNFSTVWNNQPPTVEPGAPLIGIGGGETIFGVSVGDARLVAVLTAGNGQSKQSYQLLASHGGEAELKLGERFPIVNSRFEQVVDVTGLPGDFQTPIPSFTFEDLGLIFTVTPMVHSAREVTLTFEAEFRILSGGSSNGLPVIANRQFSSQVRLSEGETALISGVATQSEFQTRSGLAGLSRIPIIGRIFSGNTRQVDQNNLVLVIRPRVVRLPPAELAPALSFLFGPEQRPVPSL